MVNIVNILDVQATVMVVEAMLWDDAERIPSRVYNDIILV